jgi:hypothetical protein
MSLWLTLPLGVAIIALLIVLVKRGGSGATALHIDH